MSTVRKSGRNNYKQAQPRRTQRRAPATRRKANPGWSMKLGAWAHARLREAQYDSVSRKVLQVASISILAGIFLIIASAFGIVEDVKNGINSASVKTARFAGFTIKDLEIISAESRPISNAQKSEVEAIAGIPITEVLFNVDPQEIRDRIMVLNWVEDVIVRRLWPNSLQIIVVPRAASAVWQENGNLEFIDNNGKSLGPADPQKVKGLPLVIGENAAKAAPSMIEIMSKHQTIAGKTHALVYVSQRRWDIKLRSGAIVALPEYNVENALVKIEDLHSKYRILDRKFARLDVRIPEQIIIRPSAERALSNTQSV